MRSQITSLADESIGYMQDLTQPTYTGWHRYMLVARERRIDRIRHVSRFLLTPGVGDWDAVQLPKFVTPLYRLVRLARVGQVAAQYAFRRDIDLFTGPNESQNVHQLAHCSPKPNPGHHLNH